MKKIENPNCSSINKPILGLHEHHISAEEPFCNVKNLEVQNEVKMAKRNLDIFYHLLVQFVHL